MSNLAEQSSLVLHLPRSQMIDDMERAYPFYRRIRDEFTLRGGKVEVIRHERALTMMQAELDDNFHLCDHGWVRHPRVLNTGLSYIIPYWNCDPNGIRSLSRIGNKAFRPSEVDAKTARKFARRLRNRLVKKRQSRYAQPDKVETSLPDGSIAIFLQSEAHRSVEERLYLDRDAMIKSVCEAGLDRPIIIKVHPKDEDPNTPNLLSEMISSYDNVHVSTANIHDIFAVSDVSVSINSATSIEGFLHNVPAVLCGKADYRHRCETVRHGSDMRRALDAALQRDIPFDKYLYWYFGENCLDGRADDLIDHLLGRIAQTGFDVSKFGLD